MLRISKLADYGTVLMNSLAMAPNEVKSAKNLAGDTGVSLPTVSKLLKILHESGLVEAQRGVNGGYALARQAQTITIAEVIAAVEGWPAMTECSDHAGCCSQSAHCGVKDNWQLINQVIMTALSSVSVADMTKPLQYHPLIQKGISFLKGGEGERWKIKQ